MKRMTPSVWMAVALGLVPAILLLTTVNAWSQTPAPTKKAWGGNQLSGGVPKTQSPASIVGPVPGPKAKVTETLLELRSGSVLYLAGDSTLHKFEIGAKALFGSAILGVAPAAAKADGGLLKALKGGQVSSMDLTIPVTLLKSKEKGLDENAYKALKAKDFSEIKFALDSITLAADKKTLTAKGKLTIAGSTQPVVLTGEVEATGKQLRVKGVYKLKMSAYQVQPPAISIVVTTIKVMDEIEVHFDVVFAPKD